MFSLSAMLEGFRKGSTRRSSIRALKGLSAAQLRDIGVAPDQIGEVIDAMVDSGWRRAEMVRERQASTSLQLPRRTAEVSCG
jgi:uncharacterized protein YjiS (DUF1127 family)